MSAAKFIGRVGGLAVALGVSTAALNGSAVAWADDASSGSSSATAASSSASAKSSSADAGSVASPSANGQSRGATTRPTEHSVPQASISSTPADPADSPSASGDAVGRDRDAATPSRTTGRSRARLTIDEPAPSDAPAAVTSARPVQPAASPPAAVVSPVSTTATSTGSVGDPPEPLSDNDPVPPADPSLDAALLALARRESDGTAVATIPSAVTSPSLLPTGSTTAPAQAAVPLAAQNTALILSPSGVPIPSPDYIARVMELYVGPNSPAGTIPLGVSTPEGLYPITGVKSLPLNTSVDEGLEILNIEIDRQLVAGNTMTVFGYSQSAIISSLAMEELDPSTSIEFILTGNEMNPDGGLLSRFPNLSIPSLGLDFYGATPPDSFPVTNYTLEYDGFADFPRYPLNFLSVLNAGFGIVFIHPTYTQLTEDQVTPVALGGQAIELPTSSPTQRYFIIPTENLPLLTLVRALPVIGTPIADLLQPALRVIVNLGYGDPAYGWSTGTSANEQTTFGVIPSVDWISVANDFIAGVWQGLTDFADDIGPEGSVWGELAALPSSLPDPAATLASLFNDPIASVQTLVLGIAERISGLAAATYAAALPTADIINAFVTILPAYDLSLFLDGVTQVFSGDPIGGLVNAVGLPAAATVGLGTTAGLVEVLVLLQVVGAIAP